MVTRLTALALAFCCSLAGQQEPIRLPIDTRWFRAIRAGGLSFTQLVGLWTPGACDGSLNTGCRWTSAGENLLLQSEDLSVTWAETGLGTIDDATHFTFAAQNDVVHQTIATIQERLGRATIEGETPHG